MIESTHRYVMPLLRTWTALSQQCLRWLNRPDELVIHTYSAAHPISVMSAEPSLQEAAQDDEGVDPLDKQPQDVHIRSLVVRCRGLTRQYQTTPEVVLERWWWRSLHRAGVRLRETLAKSHVSQETLSLTKEEWDQAYFQLIHVAYFFEPGGIAEEVCNEQRWPLDAPEFQRF